MTSITLNKNWRMKEVGAGEWVAASVPGSVYSDLLNAGLMEDPFWRDNELEALKLCDKDYTYETSFEVQDSLLKSDDIILQFEGIDTLADIYLNDTLLESVANMHRTWEFPVKDLLKEGENVLRVEFHSPTKYIEEMHLSYPQDGSTDAMRGFSYLRKAHCMFGWDWGPRLPDMGIWKEVKLLGVNKARLDSVYITQTHEENLVTLDVDVQVELASNDEASESCCCEVDCSYRVTITSPDGDSKVYEDAPSTITVENPQLWWPNGYGAQPLYTIKVELICEGNVVDEWTRKYGLRTLTIHRENDEYGECFCHRVNGVDIFAMGADYIPEDNIYSRITPERTYDLLKQCVAANFNTVRVWGGGNYPVDNFFEACDELGLIVWQDFMFACAAYRLTEEFEENIIGEFIDNIKRIRHHACLALWCGNNEIEGFTGPNSWLKDIQWAADYIKIFEYILPQVLKEYDPQTFYWPSSPSSGGAFNKSNDENMGDVHYWDVWHGNKPITEYRKFYFRYVSEFGFQSFPGLKSVEKFTLPEDRNIFSYVMEKHQRNSTANGKIMNYMEQTYLYPSEFGTLLYASQLLQADAIRYGVEHFRRHRGRCMGAIYWQLNDCWPTASWASIDYYGRWKALHYYAKRFFAPILLSCQEEGILTQDTNPNAQPYDVIKSIHLNISNETMADQLVTVKWALRNNRAEIKRQGEEEVKVPALSAIWLDKECMEDANLYEDYVSYDLYQDGQLISSGTVMFTPPKHFHFVKPELSYRLEGDEIVITTDVYTRSVEIINEADDLLLSDNYFDMNAGETRVKILAGSKENIQLHSVYDIR